MLFKFIHSWRKVRNVLSVGINFVRQKLAIASSFKNSAFFNSDP